MVIQFVRKSLSFMEHLSGYSCIFQNTTAFRDMKPHSLVYTRCGKIKKKIMLLTFMIEKITEIKVCLLPGNPCWL